MLPLAGADRLRSRMGSPTVALRLCGKMSKPLTRGFLFAEAVIGLCRLPFRRWASCPFFIGAGFIGARFLRRRYRPALSRWW